MSRRWDAADMMSGHDRNILICGTNRAGKTELCWDLIRQSRLPPESVLFLHGAEEEEKESERKPLTNQYQCWARTVVRYHDDAVRAVLDRIHDSKRYFPTAPEEPNQRFLLIFDGCSPSVELFRDQKVLDLMRDGRHCSLGMIVTGEHCSAFHNSAHVDCILCSMTSKATFEVLQVEHDLPLSYDQARQLWHEKTPRNANFLVVDKALTTALARDNMSCLPRQILHYTVNRPSHQSTRPLSLFEDRQQHLEFLLAQFFQANIFFPIDLAQIIACLAGDRFELPPHFLDLTAIYNANVTVCDLFS